MPITIWNRDNIPKEHEHLFSTFDDEWDGNEIVENTMFVIHISAAMQTDYCFKLANQEAHQPQFNSDISSWLGSYAMGANVIHTEREKNGDGHIIVLGGI